MLEVRQLAVSYGQHRAVKGVDLRVAAGEIVVILGANGAGKTSLLKAIAGLVPSAPGSQVTMDGQGITGVAPHRIVETGLALVPEGRGIFGDLPVRDNLALGGFAHRARTQAEANLQRVLSLFPRLGERQTQLARTMSGGEQQMVAIGRALMSAPTILMLDEPSLGLSPLLCGELFRNLQAIRQTGVGILLVEQNARQSLAIADRAYLLENGAIAGEGPAAQLARDPAVQAAYLGGAASGKGGRVAAAGTTAQSALPAHAAHGANTATTTPVDAGALAARALASLVPNAASTLSTPADTLVPTRIADLVQIATRRQAEDVQTQRETPNVLDPQTVAEAMAGVEAAAARALQPRPKPPQPVVGPDIQVWRRPGIEVWRRQPDGSLQQEN
jgi:branched-chain amino acid transport system ATP-binding protein